MFLELKDDVVQKSQLTLANLVFDEIFQKLEDNDPTMEYLEIDREVYLKLEAELREVFETKAVKNVLELAAHASLLKAQNSLGNLIKND